MKNLVDHVNYFFHIYYTLSNQTAFASLIKVSYDQLMYEENLFHYQIIESVP